MDQDSNDLFAQLHDVKNQVTIIKSKLFLAKSDQEKASSFGDVASNVQKLSIMMHQISLQADIRRGVYTFSEEAVLLKTIFETLQSEIAISVSNKVAESVSVRTDQELLFQYVRAIFQIIASSGSTKVTITSDVTGGVTNCVEFISNAPIKSQLMSEFSIPYQLVQQISKAIQIKTAFTNTEDTTTITCRLGQ